MRDIRSNDLKRKLSQIRGQRIHTFEFRLFKNEIELEEINIRCVIKLVKEDITEEETEEISRVLQRKVQVRTLFEFYSVLSFIHESSRSSVNVISLEADKSTEDLIKSTILMEQLKLVKQLGDLCHILVTHAEVNTIEGLEKEISEATIVLSFLSTED